MKHFSTFITLIAFSLILITGCGKESPAKEQKANDNSMNGNVQAQNGIPPRPIDQFTGLYDATGTRILYNGNINDSDILAIAEIPSPKEMTAADNYTLVCDYADLGGSGWQYVMRYDPNTRTWDVQPNETMAQSITPGSFTVIAKQFYKNEKKFYLKTFYTNTSGSDRIVEKTLVHQ